jgi:multidrug efflux pump subunit AcrA (membrane-fusion protein)
MIYPSGITPTPPTSIDSRSVENLPAIKNEEFLPQISRWTSLGGLVMMATVTSSLILAIVTTYRVTIASLGIIRPTGELRLVQASVEGRVVKILEKENELVRKGDVIATLDNSEVKAKQDRIKIQVRQIQFQITQVNAQLREIDRQILAEIDHSKRSISVDRLKLSLSQRNHQEKQIKTQASVHEAQAKIGAAQNEWQKAQAQWRAVKADYRSTQASLQSAFTKQSRYQKVAKLGAISQDQFEEAKLAFQQQQEKLRVQTATIEAQQQTIAQLHQNIRAAQAQLHSLQATLNPTNAEVSIASENIAQNKATGEVASAVLNREKASMMQKKIELDRQLAQDKRELQQIAVNLQQSKIIATEDGIIVKLNLRNPGQVVRSGEEIAQIVPSGNALAIETTVAPSEIGKLKTGQKVQMQVSACPYPDYGTLGGVVSQISADTFKPQSSLENVASPTISSYKVTIEPNSLMLDRGQRKCAIQLGMEGKTEIIAGEETFLRFLLRKSGLSINMRSPKQLKI